MPTNVLRKSGATGRWLPLVVRPNGGLRSGVVLAITLIGLLVYGYPAWGTVVWAVLLAAAASVRLEVGERTRTAWSRVFFAIGPLVTYSLVEVLNYNDPWRSFPALQVALNLAWYYLGALLLYLIIGRRDLATSLGVGLGWALGMANHYVISFRGRTLFPGDFLTLGTAFNVAGSYDYTPDRIQVTTGLILLLFLLVVAFLPRRRGRTQPSWRLTVPALIAAALFVGGFFGTDFLSRAGIEPSMWTTRGNGLALNFSVCLRYSRVEQPTGYTPGNLEQISRVNRGGAASVPTVLDGVTRPVNVITIMNESFSDLGVIPGTEANQDWMPFCRALTENTVKGYAYASVFGGTTANSEYEFLTGNTTAFLPTGTVPYHMFVSDGDPSLVAQMKDLGYRSLAMHPYLPSGWNRIPVYNAFGFDGYMFQDDFKNPTYTRGYISDQSNFENIIDQYEQKEPEEKLFLFNVTMQNHSGYDLPWTGLERTTWLTGKFAGRFQTVNQYLSSIYQSDRAFEYLIDYFSTVEEPTMILMFGDHQPMVATNYYTEALGGADGELDARTVQRKQMVPFLIWANYDIPEAEGVELSLNYLSTLLMKTANLPLTGYQTFLDGLYEDLPIVNAVGFRDSDGNWATQSTGLSSKAQKGLEEYQKLLYNNIFDKKNRITDFYTLRK